MKNSIQFLSILLVVQLIGAALLSFQGSGLETFQPEEPFLNLSLDSLTEIRVIPPAEKQDEAVTLKKQDGNWVLENYFQFPVSEKKLESFSKKLFTLQKPFPVGTTKIAEKQFEVAEEKFASKIEFVKDGNVVNTIFLGSAPSFKKVHARVAGSDLTYAIPFSAYDLQGKPSTWIDRDYLKLSDDEVQLIQFKDLTLRHTKGNTPPISLEGLQADEEPNEQALSDFMRDLLKIGFLDVLGTDAKDEYNLSAPALTYTVQSATGEKSFTYGKLKDDSAYALKVSDKPFYFKISNFQVEKLTKITRETLVKKKENEKPADAITSGEANATESSTSTDDPASAASNLSAK
ncbi:MAG: DUF4340 domain-containing protein [Bdellovibrionales bacterium]|nr:DUF4340 domain-containing protein [Bdellovibrionales bacterium]